MRRREGPLLLALGLVVGACGPSGAWSAPETGGEKPEVASRVEAPASRPGRARAGDPIVLRVDPERTWRRAWTALDRRMQTTPAYVRIESDTLTTIWTPKRAARPGPSRSSGLRVRLWLDADPTPFVQVRVDGSAWVARHGCNARDAWRIRGWGESTRPGLASDLDSFLDAVDHDPLRIRVEIEVALPVWDGVRWADVLPILDECASAEVGVLKLGDHPGSAPVKQASPETSLEWLAVHQAPDGRWPAADFGSWCDGMAMGEVARDGAGHPAYDVGATGLALSAFLGAGYTHRGRHPYAKRIWKAVRWLKEIQRPDGCFGNRHDPWLPECHAIATLALVEIYGMTGSPVFKEAAQRGLDVLPSAYASSAADDHVSTFFTVSALASAQFVNADARKREREAPLLLPTPFTEAMRSYVSDPGGSGEATLAAASLFGRILLGREPGRSDDLAHRAEAAGRRPPVWDPEGHTIDMPHWLFASLALFQVRGEPWKQWNHRLEAAVVDSQRRDGVACCYRGSWDPHGPGAARFGRVGATALMTLCSQVYYRYDRVFGRP